MDGAGNVYSWSEREVVKYTSTGTSIGRVIPSRTTGQASAGEVFTGLAVDLSDNELYIDVGGSGVERFAPPCEPNPFADNPYCAVAETFGPPFGGGDLAVDSATASVYVLEPGSDRVVVYSPEVHSSPTVESESVANVASTSGTLTAGVDPRGSATEYHFEYGACTSAATCASSAYEHSAPVPDAFVGSDFNVYSPSEHVQDLLPGTVYHFRVVAHNEDGTTYGERNEVGEEVVHTFTTQTADTSFVLPDGREWEMVTPPDKQGALLYGYESARRGLASQASVDGDAVVPRSG